MRRLTPILGTVCLLGATAGAYQLATVRTIAVIQATCDAPDEPTVLNGKPYICLDVPTWSGIVRALKEHQT